MLFYVTSYYRHRDLNLKALFLIKEKKNKSLTPVLTIESIVLSLRANVSPCFILMRFLSRHFMAYILPVSAFRQPYTSPKPPLPIIRCTLKSFIVSCNFRYKTRDNLILKIPFLKKREQNEILIYPYLDVQLQVFPLAETGVLIARNIYNFSFNHKLRHTNLFAKNCQNVICTFPKIFETVPLAND